MNKVFVLSNVTILALLGIWGYKHYKVNLEPIEEKIKIAITSSMNNSDNAQTKVNNKSDSSMNTKVDKSASSNAVLDSTNKGTPWKVGIEFSLKDHLGNTFTKNDMMKKEKSIVFFGFTRCEMVCPKELTMMTSAMNLLKTSELEKLNVMFVTLDPEYDTPEVLKDYLKSFDQRIKMLTGDFQTIKKILNTYKVYSSNEEVKATDKPINHSSFFYMVDNKSFEVEKQYLPDFELDIQYNTGELVKFIKSSLNTDTSKLSLMTSDKSENAKK